MSINPYEPPKGERRPLRSTIAMVAVFALLVLLGLVAVVLWWLATLVGPLS
jgi:hypothetical protein